jgi:GAF domain-containing protein
MNVPIPSNEAERLNTLRGYKILDTHPEDRFDDLTRLAALICRTPIALISLVDADWQWFKSKIGLVASQTPREDAFCAYAIMTQDILVVPDATRDPRFASNSLVLGEPGIRLYAGAPLTAPDGHNLGALCVIDRKPRRLSRAQLESLRILGRQVVAEVTLGKNLQAVRTALNERDELERDLLKLIQDLQEAKVKIRTLEGMIPMCAWCKRVRDDKGYWGQVEAYVKNLTGLDTTSSICPDCLQRNFGRATKPASDPTAPSASAWEQKPRSSL